MQRGGFCPNRPVNPQQEREGKKPGAAGIYRPARTKPMKVSSQGGKGKGSYNDVVEPFSLQYEKILGASDDRR